MRQASRALTLISVVGLFLLVVVGAYLWGFWMPNFPSNEEYPVRGIDVSAHQGRVDWKLVAESRVSFVYLKATEGGDFRDAEFARNLREARGVGLVCGAYHFFGLRAPGLAQARNFIGAVPKELVSLPPAVDLEFWGNAAVRPSVADFQRELQDYLEAVTKEYGKTPVIYTSDEFAAAYLEGMKVERPWVRAVVFRPGDDEPWVFWQFTERARVPGVRSFVDMDVFRGDRTEFHELTGY